MGDLYVGLMSGTSMDGVDAALIEDCAGFPCLGKASCQYSPELQSLLNRIVADGHVSLLDLLQADQGVAETFMEACRRLLAKLDIDARQRVRAIGMHGQTIFHAPQISQSLQIGNPNLLAARLGIPVVADLRRADMALGGEGAPLAPAFHQQAFRSDSESRVILNLGGIANISWLPARTDDDVTGFDTGPANTLLDSWIQTELGKDHDEDGNWARSGRVQPQLLQRLLADPYFSRPAPKSSGREYFNLDWLQSALEDHPGITPVDVQATLCELTACSVADAIKSFCPGAGSVHVCGGGWHNGFLIERLRARLPQLHIDSTAALGIDPQLVEASAFAWIARQHMHGQAASLPSVTGASEPAILGALYPVPGCAADPLRNG